MHEAGVTTLDGRRRAPTEILENGLTILYKTYKLYVQDLFTHL